MAKSGITELFCAYKLHRIHLPVVAFAVSETMGEIQWRQTSSRNLLQKAERNNGFVPFYEQKSMCVMLNVGHYDLLEVSVYEWAWGDNFNYRFELITDWDRILSTINSYLLL